MLDLKSKAVAETGTLDLDDADGEALFDGDNRCSITFYSPGSRVYAEADAERQNRMMELVAKKGGKMKLSAEERRQLDAQFLAKVTASFNHLDYRTEDKLTGYEMFKAAYLDREVGFIADQGHKFLSDWGNFTAKSAKK